MAADRWERVKQLFDAALALDPSERRAFIKGVFATEPSLREEVESLIASHDEADSSLEVLPIEELKALSLGATTGTQERPVEAEEGARQDIGPYRILGEIGRGGMGVVYEAEQERPVHRRVALKLIKWGMDTRAVVARFESERQALALMNHPNIAGVYDAGATEQGRPYFAMELVHGEPITEYCDKNRLTIRERLDLFIRVCEGVQHAHQKGIIHRDIKPANILVTIQDDKPVPKIIDFGVAKATSQRLTERTVYTELGQLIGTPEYMSPEQAEMTGLDIDTRTDVYSLGVVLYELLVGTPPFDAEALRQASFDDMRRRIREEEPLRPSTRLSRLGEWSTKAAKNRRVEVRTLERALRGDLDWITMKALEKDRTRRYETPNALGLEIERCLNSEPVRARAPTATYRMGKFIDRHRGPVASVAAFGLIAVGFLVIYTTNISQERDRAESALERSEAEARKAKAINEFLQETLGSADPFEAFGQEVTVVQALDAAISRAGESFAGQPEIEAAVRNTIGATLLSLGRYDAAEEQLKLALKTRRVILGGAHPDLAESLNNLALVLQGKGEYDDAEPLYRESLAMRRKLLGEEHPVVATTLTNLALLLQSKGDYDGAEPLYRESLAIARKLLGEEHPNVAESLNNLALVLHGKGNYEEAELLYRESLMMLRKLVGDEHPHVAVGLLNLALLLEAKGDFDRAEPLFRESLAMQRKLLGDEHPDVGQGLSDLGRFLVRKGDAAAGEPLHRAGCDILEKVLGPDHLKLAQCRIYYGECLTELAQYQQAERLLLAAHSVLKGNLGEDNEWTETAISHLVKLYESWGKPEKAAEYRAMLTKEESE